MMGHSQPLFLYFRLLNIVDGTFKLCLRLDSNLGSLMLVSDCSTNCATTTSQELRFLLYAITLIFI